MKSSSQAELEIVNMEWMLEFREPVVTVLDRVSGQCYTGKHFKSNWLWWLTSVVPALGKLRQEDCCECKCSQR